MSPETLSPKWEWYYVAIYFFIGGVSAGAYFIGSLVELMGRQRLREISRIAYYIAFPLILVAPFLLIADLGQPARFWHLFFYSRNGIPYMNTTSALSVGTWALLIYGLMSFLSFLNVLAADGRLKSPALARLFDRIPHKVYAAIGTFFGFFVAGYTGVLLNITARPVWAATDPFVGSLFIASAASSGAAAIALVMASKNIGARLEFAHLQVFDRVSMIIELVLIVLMIFVAGRFAAPLLTGWYGFLFWVGAVIVGVIIPLWMTSSGARPRIANPVVLTNWLVLVGSAMLRVTLVQAGQV